MQKIMNSLHSTAMKYGMKINIKTTKVCEYLKKGVMMNITISRTKIDQLKSFKCLCHTITDDGRREAEMKYEIEKEGK